MRITQIELKNFRGFRNCHKLELDQLGKNVLIYGENGSGKSSLFHALNQFLNASTQSLVFSDSRNIFAAPTDDSYIRLLLHDGSLTTSFEWSDLNSLDISKPEILAANKFSGFLEYRDILKTHLLTPGDQVNIFNLLVNTLLVDLENPFTSGFTFSQNWKDINTSIPRDNRRTTQITSLQTKIDAFNDGLAAVIPQLESQLATVFSYFGYGTNIIFSFDRSDLFYQSHAKAIGGQSVILKVEFGTINLNGEHPRFLNEAKLSAIGISIYLSALLLNPSPASSLAILVLDDVLIGLDMSNRLHIVDILKNHFLPAHQIFMLTYDHEWFDILFREFNVAHSNQWKAFEFYCSRDDQYEIPVFVERQEIHKAYLKKAEDYFNPPSGVVPDYKAAAVYVRSAFEATLKHFCNRKHVPIKYYAKEKDIKIKIFWDAVWPYQNTATRSPYVLSTTKTAIDTALAVVMNPLSHAQSVSSHRGEVQRAINAVKQLQTDLSA